MAIEPLLGALGQDAERDIREIAEAARVEAERIRAAAQARVAQRCANALQSREAELRSEGDAQRARALREARASMLRARDAFLERVFLAVTTELRGELRKPEREAALAKLVSEALDFVSGEATIRCRADVAERLRRRVASLNGAKLVATEAIGEGVVVKADDGSVTIDNTLENRLQLLRPALSIEVLARFERGQ
jgi:vacuolar-type H+-ATPase subunit E/Vma4